MNVPFELWIIAFPGTQPTWKVPLIVPFGASPDMRIVTLAPRLVVPR
jgi:hypothetical protein